MWIKAIKWIIGIVTVYAILGFFAVPYALKKIAPEKISEVTNGGDFSISGASFNPFSFHLSLKNLEFKTPHKGKFVSFEEFVINLDPFAYFWKHGVVISDVRFKDPKITIQRDLNGAFNFQWLSELGSDDNESASSPPKLIIEHFEVINGTLDYTDYAEGKSYDLHMGPIGFSLDHIDLRDLSSADGKMRLYATINEGGFIDISGKIDSLSPLMVGGKVAFDSGKLYTPWRYFKEKFPIEVADGTAAFGFDYRFNGADINSTELSNLRFEINKLRVIPKGERQEILNVRNLSLTHGRVFPLKKVFQADALNVNGINLSAHRFRDGKIDWQMYAEEIQKAFPEDENETKEPWQYSLGRVGIDNIALRWNDDAPKEPYESTLSNLSVQTGMISSEETAVISASMQTDALRAIRKRDGVQIAGIEKIGIEGIEVDRMGHFAGVGKVTIIQPDLSLKRLSDNSFDVSQYLYISKSTSKDTSNSPWGYKIAEIEIQNGAIAMIDQVPAKDVALRLDKLDATLRNLSHNPKETNQYTLSSRVNSKGSVELKGEVVRSALHANGRLNIKGFDISLIDPYVEPSTYASLRRGDLSLGIEYDYTPAKASVKGKVGLNDWVLNDTRDNSVLLGWEGIGVTPFIYSYPSNQLKINQLVIDGFYTNALIDKNKVLNYTTLSKQGNSESNVSTASSNQKPFGLEIVKLILRNSSATFSDQSLPLPFKTYIHDLEGSVLGISTAKEMRTFVKLGGGVDQYGLAKIDGSLSTKDPKKFTDIKVKFDNLELKQYTPYSLQFLGYQIDGGKLFLNLGYKIDEGALKGANQVVIKHVELGAEKEGGSPWPLRFVVALLEDSDGVIDIDLPIEGDVNNPDFKYGKIVWQVIGNLFTKAVTSPFRLLGSLMGVDGDKIAAVDFEAGSSVLLPPQIEKLDIVSTMLSKRPKLSLNIYGGWNDEHDVYALKGVKLVQAALKRDKSLKIDTPNAIRLELLEEMAEDTLNPKELKETKKAMRETYTEEPAFVRHFSEYLIAKLIPLQTLEPKELELLAQRRASAINTYLLKTPGFEKRLILKGIETVKSEKSDAVPNRLEIVVP